jgi:hypothetical protein
MKSITRFSIFAVSIGMAAAAASPASAAPMTAQHPPTTVKMICERYGGTYGPPDGNGGGEVCFYPDGSFTNCTVKNKCTHYPATTRINPGAPINPGSTGQGD